MLDYKVENEAATPRLCLQFSEDLAKFLAQIDWKTFISVDGKDAASLTAEERQICIDGVAHGKRYEVTVRAGLPSAIASETLLKTAELGVYIRDRSASVRAGANTYVLPSRGQAGIPLTTVNTDRLAIEVYRIGDRSLATPLLSGDLRKQLAPYQISKVRKAQGERVWRGEMPVKSTLNEEVATAFPVSEAIGALKPGVYLLTAQPASGKPGDKPADAADRKPTQRTPTRTITTKAARGKQATQWFIVSDLGLTAFSAEDGVHGFVRSLGTAEPAKDIEVRLVARNNEVLATQKTDARGYVRFAAGLTKGESGNAPAILVAERAGGGDYAFLDLTAAAFDLTDRGVAGRERAGALEAHVFTERGVYKPGETVHLTALVRDAALKAPKAMPVTRRPVAARWRRASPPADRGSGFWRPHRLAGAVEHRADRHVARARACRSEGRRHRRGRLPRRGFRSRALGSEPRGTSRRASIRQRPATSASRAAISMDRPPPISPSKAKWSCGRVPAISTATRAIASVWPTSR